MLVQRMVEGDDVRVHVVRDVVIACRFSSAAIDYRSDREAEKSMSTFPPTSPAFWWPRQPSRGWSSRAGISRSTGTVRTGASSATPMPGYSFYDRACEGAISDALIRVLSG